jgi:ADP-ribosyl-[dinitrogen reductase] hydrolase
METLSRFQGCILGLAVGDALGKAGEFLALEQIIATYGGELREFTAPQNYMASLRPEQFTDDTLMAIVHAESIIAKGKVDPEDIARRFIAWYDGGDLRGIGITVGEAITRLKEGASWQESGKRGEHAAGNGTAMRIAPIGLLHYADVLTDPDALRHDARVASIITHNNAEAIAGSRAIAYAVARLAGGDDSLDTLIENTVNFIGENKVSENLRGAENLLRQAIAPTIALDQLGTTGYVVHTVASAFYCFLHTPDNFEQTVVNAVMGASDERNDADTTAAIAGAISGAYNGIAAIPARWRDEIEDRVRLLELAGKLYLLTQTQEIR